MAVCEIRVQSEPLSAAEEWAHAEQQDGNCGAVVGFVGKVRGGDHDKALSHLWLTHLPEATETEIGRIVQAACTRWQVAYCRVVHRVGRIAVNEPIVAVFTASPHRNDAYLANRFIMDKLKTDAPFWKKECFADGSEHWVEMKHSDVAHAQNWDSHDDGGQTD